MSESIRLLYGLGKKGRLRKKRDIFRKYVNVKPKCAIRERTLVKTYQ